MLEEIVVCARNIHFISRSLTSTAHYLFFQPLLQQRERQSLFPTFNFLLSCKFYMMMKPPNIIIHLRNIFFLKSSRNTWRDTTCFRLRAAEALFVRKLLYVKTLVDKCEKRVDSVPEWDVCSWKFHPLEYIFQWKFQTYEQV
jgi:hypothetical protein